MIRFPRQSKMAGRLIGDFCDLCQLRSMQNCVVESMAELRMWERYIYRNLGQVLIDFNKLLSIHKAFLWHRLETTDCFSSCGYLETTTRCPRKSHLMCGFFHLRTHHSIVDAVTKFLN